MTFTEPCARCRGSGIRFFVIDGVRTRVECRPCKGVGTRTFKESPEKRQRVREMAQARKKRKITEGIEAFRKEYPAVAAWMDFSSNPFAAKMRDALSQWGGLTDRQLEVSLKMAAKKYDS